MSVKRIWHGWATHANAGAYEAVLANEVLPSIEAKNIPGYAGIEVLRRAHADEVEFVTIMTFGSLADVIAFQGEDYERCYVPDAAKEVLARWDETAAHYELHDSRRYD